MRFPNEEHRTAGAASFDRVADLYDKARPGYPDEIFAAMLELAGCGPDSRVLEIGCGTGKASVSLAPKAGVLVCLEPGPQLAAIARSNLRQHLNAAVIESTFESWRTVEPFDLIVAATSWHWVDPSVGFKKAWEDLKPYGHLALINNGHAFPEDFDSFFSEMQPCYDAIRKEGEEKFPWPPPPPDRVPDGSEKIRDSGLFEPVEGRRVVWPLTYTAEEYIDLISTYSQHLTMEASKNEILYAEIRRLIGARPSRTILKHNLTTLAIGRRLDYPSDFREDAAAD
jgi:SAM-dependent methyltransferase